MQCKSQKQQELPQNDDEDLDKDKEKRPRVPDPEQDAKQTQVKKKRKILSFEDQQQEVVIPVQKSKLKQFHRPLQKQLSEQDEQNMKLRLREEFLRDSEKKGEQLFELQYSYWDSGQIVKKLKRKKKEKIIDLLKICRLQLIHSFQNLAKVSAQQLMFVIKDFVAPHNMSIHEIEMLNIKTKTGEALLSFHKASMKREGKEMDMYVNIGNPIRVIEKAKYEKSKTFHPFATWHTLDLEKNK